MYPCHLVHKPHSTFATCPSNIFYSKRSNWGSHVAFSCHHSSASFKLEDSPVFPWLSWPWHCWVLPIILYKVIGRSWLTLDHENWLFTSHEFCRQVEVMLKWPSWDSSDHGNATNIFFFFKFSSSRELVVKYLPAHCWWMSLCFYFSVVSSWFDSGYAFFLAGSQGSF